MRPALPTSRERQPRAEPETPGSEYETMSDGDADIVPLLGADFAEDWPGSGRSWQAEFYQLLSGHAATAEHLVRVGQAASDKCWWCGSRERQLRRHLFIRCQRWGRRSEGCSRESSGIASGGPLGPARSASSSATFGRRPPCWSSRRTPEWIGCRAGPSPRGARHGE